MKIESRSLVSSVPDRLESVAAVLSLLSRLNQCQICEENGDGKFGELLLQARFLKSSGMHILHFTQCIIIYIYIMYFYFLVFYGSAYVGSQLLGRRTICHRNCDQVVEGGVKCLPCKGHRNTLHAIAARLNKTKTVTTDCTSVSSHVNYMHLSSPDKKQICIKRCEHVGNK